MRSFRKLKVWERAHRLTLAVYKATKAFPADERYGLTSQMRRSAASVPANIAEGCGREGDADRARSFHIALGSASELEYHLLLANDLGLLEPDVYEWLSGEVVQVKKMLTALARKLKAEA